MKVREVESVLIKELLDETTPEEMERINKEMTKQTAVEWLACEIGGLDTGVSYHYFAKKVEEAKEIEKEQIEDAYEIGFADAWDDARYDDEPKYAGSEQYYNETYGGKS